MASSLPSNRGAVPPLESWRQSLRPQGLADRLHGAVSIALRIAAGAGYHVAAPTEARPRFEFEQVPSEDWALPRPVQEAVQLLELANEIVPLLTTDPPGVDAAFVERAFTAGELAARMPAWDGVKARGPSGR